MKRLFSFMMALVLILSLSVTAFADEPEEPGSITITNATINHSYSLFKIFDASYAVGEDGNTLVDADGNPVIAYSITTDNQFFSYMFGTDGKTENPYFSYDADDGTITRKKDTAVADIISYLTDMVRDEERNFTAVTTKTATTKTVEFDNLPYGYYLIDKGNGAAVTIDSNAPDVEVIDKNQIPGTDFSKQVGTKKLKSGSPILLPILAILLTLRSSSKPPTMTVKSRSSTTPWPIPRAMLFG